MSYRPITDIWFLARAKLKGGKKYYGAYLGGFPERARVLIGVPRSESMLHACGGMAKHYPYSGGFCVDDRTADIDPACEPDYCWNLEKSFPTDNPGGKGINLWKGILIDPPYSSDDAAHYQHSTCPKLNTLMKNAWEVLEIGGKVGVIHYSLPARPKNSKFTACVGVACGFNNRIRVFSVFEKLA